MLPLMMLVPAATSLILGGAYLLAEEARPALKILGTVVFLAAVYLQFRSPYPLAGILLQVALALVLVLWRKLGDVT